MNVHIYIHVFVWSVSVGVTAVSYCTALYRAHNAMKAKSGADHGQSSLSLFGLGHPAMTATEVTTVMWAASLTSQKGLAVGSFRLSFSRLLPGQSTHKVNYQHAHS